MIVVKYEILKYLRGKKLLVFIALTALILGLLTAMPYIFGDGLPKESFDLMLFYVSFSKMLIILAVTLFAADSLASEYEYRTGLLLFPRPIKREAMFAGKFIASYLVSAMMILLFYVSVFIISFIVTGGVVSEGFISLAFSLLLIFAATGLGFMLSAFIARGNTASIMLFALMLMVFPIIDHALMAAEIEPFFSLSYSADVVYFAVAAGVDTYLPYDYYPELVTSAFVLAFWSLLTIAIAVTKFKRREF